MKEQNKNITPAQLRQVRKSFGLTGTEFAALIQLPGGWRGIARWEAGDSRIPGSVAVLVNILERCPEARQVMGVRLSQECTSFTTRLPVSDRQAL